MIWNVDDDGRVLVRMRSQGAKAARLSRTQVEEHVAFIELDLTRYGVEIVTQDVQVKRRTGAMVVDVFWRADVPPQQVGAVREYLMRLARSQDGW